MKVGDLVKIYKFTQKARDEARKLGGSEAGRKDISAHRYGLIIEGNGGPEYGDYRRVLRSCDGQGKLYSIHRLEVINASR
jgi:hypothetical protein